MKTIEQKAKAYDEIIERAKTMLAAGEVMYGKENNASQLITDIIPELRESEDEKAKKIIASVFSNAGNRYIQESERDIVLAYLEKKEQKPAEISNLRDWKFIVDTVLTEHEEIGQYLDNPETERIAKKLQERFSLPQSKPAEWSEEEERILHAIEFHIGQLDSGVTINGFSSSDMLRVFKFIRLRPSWKPSEEQMRALGDYIDGEEISEYDMEEIVRLYEQLKKL